MLCNTILGRQYSLLRVSTQPLPLIAIHLPLLAGCSPNKKITHDFWILWQKQARTLVVFLLAYRKIIALAKTKVTNRLYQFRFILKHARLQQSKLLNKYILCVVHNLKAEFLEPRKENKQRTHNNNWCDNLCHVWKECPSKLTYIYQKQ